MAADLYPTKTRIMLLREVDAGQVYSLAGESYIRAPRRRVTIRIEEMRDAGWVVCYFSQWRLTDAGQVVLAAAVGAS